jgi:hypothetical protein
MAQQRLDPEAIGQARASVATTRGLSALYSNIGAIALDPLGRRTDSLPVFAIDVTAFPVGASAGATFLNPDDFDFVFASKDLNEFSDQDRLRLAKLLAPDRLSADVALNLVAFRFRVRGIGALGFEYGHQVRARMNFPENFRTSVVGSGDVFQKDQVFRNPEMGGEWVRRMRVTFGSAIETKPPDTLTSQWFPSIGFAAAIDRLDGFAHFDVDPNSMARTEVISPPGERPRAIHATGHYVFRSSTPNDTNFRPADAILKLGSDKVAPAGEGWGGGFGLSVVILRSIQNNREVIMGDPLSPQKVTREELIARDAILFGLSIDGIGSMEWDGRNQIRSRPVIDTIITEANGGITNEVLDKFQGDLDTIGPFTTSTPAQLRVGIGADITAFVPRIPGDLIASMEGAFDLNKAIGYEGGRFSLGVGWRPKRWLTIRTGVQLGGRVGSALAFGLGFRPFTWLSIDAGTSDILGVFNPDREMIDAALRIGGHVEW